VNVRPTDQSRVNSAILSIQQRSTDLAKFQDQVSSGLRVSQPSDDPAAFVQISQAKTASTRLDAYSQTVSSSTSTLNSSVSTLQDVNDLLVQARQVAQQGADSGTNGDPTANEALAVQVDGLISRALRDANSQPDGKAIYAGTATNSVPFSVATTDAQGRPATIAYNGATDRARALTGPGQTVDTRYVGSAVFQKPGADVFQSLISLRDNLRSTTLTGPARATAIGQDLTNLDAARTAIGDTTGEQSSNLATLQSVQSLTSTVKLTTDTQIGNLEGTDYASAVVKMQEQQTALTAIYATTSKLLQPGLLNFIQG
jgi:flagellar hook-associated protein 3 FlgL